MKMESQEVKDFLEFLNCEVHFACKTLNNLLPHLSLPTIYQSRAGREIQIEWRTGIAGVASKIRDKKRRSTSATLTLRRHFE